MMASKKMLNANKKSFDSARQAILLLKEKKVCASAAIVQNEYIILGLAH